MARLGAVFSHFGQIGFLGLLLALGLGVLGYLAGARARGRSGPEAQRQWARRLADASFDGLLVHRNGTILQMNRALVRLLGYREMELLGTSFANLCHPSQVAQLRTELEAPQPQIAGFTLLHADKTELRVEISSHTLELDGLPATVTAVRDITRQCQLEARLDYLTHHDVLTGMANAAMFAEKLQEAVSRNDAAGGSTAMLMLEFGTLQAVTAQLGRSGGDNLLVQIARRLSAMMHGNDTMARLNGNRFAIVQPHSGAPNRAAILASQIEAAMAEPFIVEGKAIRASMAIGVAIYPEHATNVAGLIDAGGFALNKAIAFGGAQVFSHAEAALAGFAGGESPSARDGRMPSLEAQNLAYDLRLAVPRGEIGLEYQPVFNGHYLNVAGYEALPFWRHPKDGVVAAAKFIPLADEAGLAGVLGNFLLAAACAEAVRCKVLMMAVSLSAAQFCDSQLPGQLRDILLQAGLPANRLELLVAEAIVLRDQAEAAQRLQALQNIGVMLTLDDFGTGFAKLSNLAALPFKRIRIEAKYIQALGEDDHAQAIVMAVLGLARSLQLEVTAKGVENAAQLHFLQEKDCSFVQGPQLGRPAAHALAQPGSQVSGPPLKPSLVVTQR